LQKKVGNILIFVGDILGILTMVEALLGSLIMILMRILEPEGSVVETDKTENDDITEADETHDNTINKNANDENLNDDTIDKNVLSDVSNQKNSSDIIYKNFESGYSTTNILGKEYVTGVRTHGTIVIKATFVEECCIMVLMIQMFLMMIILGYGFILAEVDRTDKPVLCWIIGIGLAGFGFASLLMMPQQWEKIKARREGIEYKSKKEYTSKHFNIAFIISVIIFLFTALVIKTYLNDMYVVKETEDAMSFMMQFI